GQRRQILEGFSLKENILGIVGKLVEEYVRVYLPQDSPEPDTAGLSSRLALKFGLEIDPGEFTGKDLRDVEESISARLLGLYEAKEKSISPELMRNLEGMVFLQIIDSKWKDHLYAMDSLREGIGLRAYGQRDPLIEYKREAFEMFTQMIKSIEEEAVESIFKLRPADNRDSFHGVFSSLPKELSHPESVKFQASPEEDIVSRQAPQENPAHSGQPKVGRNDPCPCGSGKKYKKCCGK
ncbi:MAG: SEC-C metal-binding domain-containing protein, partial [Candidatus Omnitrophota bacterium]